MTQRWKPGDVIAYDWEKNVGEIIPSRLGLGCYEVVGYVEPKLGPEHDCPDCKHVVTKNADIVGWLRGRRLGSWLRGNEYVSALKCPEGFGPHVQFFADHEGVIAVPRPEGAE